MKIEITTEGDFKDTISWLNRIKKNSPVSTLNAIGKEGVSALKGATPKDTGGTAAGWDYKVSATGGKQEVAWYNTANPGTTANVALLIQMGHGTRTGGYVPPIDYINPALKGVFSNAADRLAKEMFK